MQAFCKRPHEGGKLDIGLVEGNAAQASFAGAGQPVSALRIVAAMYPDPGMFVVRSNSPYRTIADLKGQPVAFGTPTSGLTKLARAVHRGEAKLAARLAQGRYTTAANTANEVPRSELLHPGAAHYLREIGALR